MLSHPHGQAAIGTSNIAATAAASELVNNLGLTDRWDPVFEGGRPNGGGGQNNKDQLLEKPNKCTGEGDV